MHQPTEILGQQTASVKEGKAYPCVRLTVFKSKDRRICQGSATGSNNIFRKKPQNTLKATQHRKRNNKVKAFYSIFFFFHKPVTLQFFLDMALHGFIEINAKRDVRPLRTRSHYDKLACIRLNQTGHEISLSRSQHPFQGAIALFQAFCHVQLQTSQVMLYQAQLLEDSSTV